MGNMSKDKASEFITILRELINLEEGDAKYYLFQFQSLASASQYLDLYDLRTKHVPALLSLFCQNYAIVARKIKA